MLRLLTGASLGFVAMPLLVACTSTPDEIHRKCATAANPSACEQAEYQQRRQADDALLEQNSRYGGGGY